MSTPPLQGQPPAGSDGFQPIYNQNRAFGIWSLNELWQGPGTPGQNKWVPNVNDRVIDTDTDEWYKVTSIDPTTWVAALARIQYATPDSQFSAAEQLISPDPRNPQSTMLLYLDKSVKPNTATVESRDFVYGTQSKYAQFVKGSIIDGTASIFSAMYDASGNLLGQSVPLVPINPSGTIKTTPSFKTTMDLADGELVTMIKYSDEGQVTSRDQLRVTETTFIRKLELGVKYITDISLVSPWISDTDSLLLRYPLNVPLASMNLLAQLTYSDGSIKQLPVDGTKFRIMGMEPQFLSTIIDQKLPATLIYYLDPDEVGYDVTVNQGTFMKKSYTVQTVEPEGQYTVKLYGYPTWVDATNGYRLNWFLMNLDRNLFQDVTSLVNYVTAFQPTLYGARQNIQVNIDLSQVNGTFKQFLHAQTEGITLMARGDQSQGSTNWTIAFDPGQSPEYNAGAGLQAKTTLKEAQLSTVNISQGITLQTDWLAATYGASKPLTNSVSEVGLVEPSHFQILYGTGSVAEFTMDQWNTDLTVEWAFPPFQTLYVRFIKRMPTNDLLLSICGMQVFQQN